MTKDIPESVIEAFVVKIVVKQDGFDWYLRFDGDPNDPLHMKTEGKRRKNSSVSVVGGKLPTKQNCDTGSYCQWQEISFFKFAEFTLTIEDAKEYLYSLSTKRRVKQWQDIEVKLYI